MKDIKILLLFTFFALCGQIIFAQSFYRPWASYSPTKPQKPYQSINTTNNKLSSNKCYYRNYDYEPNQIITNLDISSEEVFSFFKRCCAEHPSRCVSNYIGKNNKTLLYTLVEKKAYRYIEWILNSGFVYDAYIDSWGIYNDIDGTMVPIRNFNAMMLACKEGDLQAATLLRTKGAYLSKPTNAIGLSAYDYALQNKQYKKKDFLKYIEKEYQEEVKNIQENKQYGKYFSFNIINDIQKELERDSQIFQQKIIDKINEINKS